MIIHKLILHHLGHKDDATFYQFQAADAIRWIEKQGVELRPATRVLDLGCGHGIFGAALLQRGCAVEFSDEDNCLLPEIPRPVFKQLNIDREPLSRLGRYDLVICSNVLEHLADPAAFIRSIPSVLTPGGRMYLSWTNWLSPWGGHEFSPFHYLGAKRGHLVFDRLTGRQRKHTPFVNLFPTHIGKILAQIRDQPGLTIRKAAPRYYSELAPLVQIPIVREFLTWNVALLIEHHDNQPD